MHRLILLLACLMVSLGATWAQQRAFPAIQQDGIQLGYVDEDDDYMGHSQWPKYLTGFDANGRKRWQFPATLTYRFGEGSHTAQSTSQISTVVSVPGSGICLAVDANRTLYGIRVRDGKPLWKQAYFPYNIARTDAHGLLSLMAAGTVYENGCFGFGESVPRHGTKPETASIVYLSARTGKMRPVLFGPPVQELIVLGDKLVVKTVGNGLLQEYSILALLKPVTKRGSKVTMRRLQTLTGLTHAQPGQTPVPLWERVIGIQPVPKSSPTTSVSILAVTPQCLIVSVGPGGLQALDIHTGKMVWQREGHWQRTREDDPESGKGDSWNVVGTARGSDGETVCLLKHTEQELTLNTVPPTFGVPKHLLRVRYMLQAVSSRMGQRLWQSAAYSDNPESRFDLRNGVLIITTAGKGDTVQREYQDVLTGKPLALDMPEGRALMRQILTRNGGSALETESTFQTQGHALPDWPLRWLRADTGTVETLSLPPLGGYIYADLVQPLTPQGRMALWINMDDDYAGHSQWPKYLVGCDMQGHKVWQFPAQIQWRKGSENTVAETQIPSPILIPGTGICLALNGGLYSLRVRDGKPLWIKANFPFALAGEWFNGAFTPPAAVYRSGCFAFASRFRGKTDPKTPSVAYVSAQTGSIQPVLFGVPTDQISVSGDTLLVQTAGNTFRAYSIPALLAIPPSGTSERPARTRHLH